MDNVVFAQDITNRDFGDQDGSRTLAELNEGRRTFDHGSDAQDWRHMLAKVVSSEIVPRLMMLQHDCSAGQSLAQPAASGQPATVAGFTRCLLAAESAEAQAFLEMLQRKGVQPENILLDFFAPAARQLGELWTSDECDFIQVSVGLHRLQSLMDEISSQGSDRSGMRAGGGRLLLLAAPGETHEFGVAMVANFFRSDGWRVTAAGPASVLHQIHARSFDIAGVSLSCTRHLDRVADLLRDMRRLSRNASIRLIVGGPVFVDNPALAAELGADGTAVSAQEAVQLARSLLDANARL